MCLVGKGERGGGGVAAMTYLCIHLFPFLTVSARIALCLCRSEVLCDSFVKTQKWRVLFILSTKWNESVTNQQRLHWSLSHILYTSKSCSQTVAESLAHSHIHTGRKKKDPTTLQRNSAKTKWMKYPCSTVFSFLFFFSDKSLLHKSHGSSHSDSDFKEPVFS